MSCWSNIGLDGYKTDKGLLAFLHYAYTAKGRFIEQTQPTKASGKCTQSFHSMTLDPQYPEITFHSFVTFSFPCSPVGTGKWIFLTSWVWKIELNHPETGWEYRLCITEHHCHHKKPDKGRHRQFLVMFIMTHQHAKQRIHQTWITEKYFALL